jgi:hypothetical protein
MILRLILVPPSHLIATRFLNHRINENVYKRWPFIAGG